jgi:hypothetical protein
MIFPLFSVSTASWLNTGVKLLMLDTANSKQPDSTLRYASNKKQTVAKLQGYYG